MGLNNIIKGGFRTLGLNVYLARPVGGAHPTNYHNSPFLPKLYRQTVGRLFYFHEMVDRVAAVDSDFVECGVSIGHGILSLMLLSDLSARPRTVRLRFVRGVPGSDPGGPQSRRVVPQGTRRLFLPLDIVTRATGGWGGSIPIRLSGTYTSFRGSLNKPYTRYTGSIALLHLDC